MLPVNLLYTYIKVTFKLRCLSLSCMAFNRKKISHFFLKLKLNLIELHDYRLITEKLKSSWLVDTVLHVLQSLNLLMYPYSLSVELHRKSPQKQALLGVQTVEHSTQDLPSHASYSGSRVPYLFCR